MSQSSPARSETRRPTPTAHSVRRIPAVSASIGAGAGASPVSIPTASVQPQTAQSSSDAYDQQIETVAREVQKLKRLLLQKRREQPASSSAHSGSGSGAGRPSKRQNSGPAPTRNEIEKFEEMTRELNALKEAINPSNRPREAKSASPQPLPPEETSMPQSSYCPQIAAILGMNPTHEKRLEILRQNLDGYMLFQLKNTDLDPGVEEVMRQFRQVIAEEEKLMERERVARERVGTAGGRRGECSDRGTTAVDTAAAKQKSKSGSGSGSPQGSTNKAKNSSSRKPNGKGVSPGLIGAPASNGPQRSPPGGGVSRPSKSAPASLPSRLRSES